MELKNKKMKNNNFDGRNLIHMVLSVLAAAALIAWFFSSIFDDSYSHKSVYEKAELRATNLVGVRVADYAIKKSNSSFLIAPGAPRELELSIEFMTAGDYSAVLEAEYPHWLCDENALDKAYVDIRGGSANEHINLITHKPEETFFTIAKGQRLTFWVRNKVNDECGRASVTFYKNNNSLYFKLALCLLWTLIFLLCLSAGASPYVAALGVLTNILFIASDASLGAVSTSGLIVNTGLSVVVTACLFMFASLPKSKIITVIFLSALTYLYAFPLAFTAYSYVFSTPMSGEAIHGAMQSYDSQIIEFWQQFIGKKRTLYVIFTLVILYACLRHINLKRAKTRFAVTYSLLLLLVGFAVIVERVHESTTANLLMKSVIEYKWEIDAFKKIADQRENVSTDGQRDPAHVTDTTVIVFGESVNKKFMSSYGYVKETTPFLEKRINAGESILYKNAYSNHTHSNPTMSLILTQANQYNRQAWLESPSVFNYAKAAGVDTHWLTNHRLLGGWSNHITTIIRESDRLKTINYKIGIGSDSSNYDEGLIPLYKEAIAEKPNQITFLHLYNSHLHYCNRYPEGARQFPTELPVAIYGRIGQIRRTSEGLLGCYVNTIHYTDSILEQLIKELESKSNPSILAYVADHSEEPIDERVHNSSQFTYDMVNIPLFVWANDAWRNKHAEKWQNLIDNKNKVFTNDLMFESILGIAGITSPTIDTSKDISSGNYQSLSQPATLHGRVHINDPKNWNYWQSQNGALANDKGIELIASDIESIGQAYAAAVYGIKKLHINAQYSDDNGIQLISESDSKPIIALADFLEAISKRGLDSLLVSLKSQDEKLIGMALEEISRLKKQSSISITLVDEKPADIAPLFSPQFSTLLASELDANKSTSLWVTFKSRYTDLPATLESK